MQAPKFDQLRSHGFWVSAGTAAGSTNQLALFSKTFGAFSLSATVRLAAVGGGWCLRWNWNGAIGPSRSASGVGAVIGDAALVNNTALCFDGKGGFSLVAIGMAGAKPPYRSLHHGTAPTGTIRITLSQTADSKLTISMNDTVQVKDLALDAATVGGSLGVHVTPGASVHISELLVTPADATPQRWLQLTNEDGQLFGTPQLMKWNFVGPRARLIMPTGPAGKHVQVAVDGGVPTNISLHSANNVSAATVWEWEEGADDHGRKGLPHGHALLVRGETGSEAWLEFLPPTLSDTLSGAEY